MSAKPLRSLADLEAAGLLSPSDVAALKPVAARYAIALPAPLAAITATSDALRRQFVPDARELHVAPYENGDPISDAPFSPLEGLVHRYPDRVLLKIVSSCPVYCRFCFRREMVGNNGSGLLPEAAFAAALEYIRARSAIREVILTGGDPLVLSARRIAQVTQRLSSLPHLQVIRWHSRVPVADPARITPALVRALSATDRAVFLAIHANHADEFTADARKALAVLRRAGVTLISQSVLLRGINDSVEALEGLMRAFLAHGVKPYYLHHPDLAPGTAHFRLPFVDGLALMTALASRLSGIGMPTYVLDVPGGAGKMAVAHCLSDAPAGHVRDRAGQLVPHPDA